jgi:hypothetical protein
MVNRKLWLSSVILFVVGFACITREASDRPSAADAATDGPDAREVAPKLPPPDRKDLGAACAASGDCVSGFCVHDVCCDTACDEACFACALPGIAGQCTALDGVEDPSAATPCTGTRICAKDASGMTACRLEDGQPCAQSADCASGHCRSYFRDQDGDGYGAKSTDTIIRCDALPRPPQGFTSQPGDCCDMDPGAHPGVAAYSTSRDACASFDWNCDGAEDKQSNGNCPTTSGAPPACGQACTLVFKGTLSVLFVQACR